MKWYPSHYVTIPVSLALAAALGILSRKLNANVRKWVMRAILLCMLLSELVKQIIAFRTGYSALYLPFHYSTTYYFTLGMYIFGRGRVKHYGECTTFIGGFLLIVTLLSSPGSVVGNLANVFHSWYNFHSFAYHILVLLLWFVLLANLDYRVKRFDPLRYISFLTLWAAFAIPASRLTDFNYAGLLKSFIPPLRKLQDAAGDVVYLIAYFLFISLFATLLILLYQMILKRLDKRTPESPASPGSQAE